jgi:hypothetical protein
MDNTLVSSFIFLAAALFKGTHRSGIDFDHHLVEKPADTASPEDVVEEYYSALLKDEGSVGAHSRSRKSSRPSAQPAGEWGWPVMAPDYSRPRGILVENARIDGNRAIVPVRAGYVNPSGVMDLRLKFGVLMEQINGHWQIAGTYNK